MDEIFDSEKAAEYLMVEEKTVRYLMNMKRLPSFKVGRHIRFRRSALEEWAKSQELC